MNSASEYVVTGYRPEKLFRFFEDISKIPRGSGNEQAISNYLLAFGRERGIDCLQDSLGNILYRLPGTEGREDEGTVILQGHMDMVCEKNNDSDHDFLSDPLDLYVEDGYLRARGTTLGGDNGIAIAAMMAIADGELASHPPLECLMTISEETGLDGANGFDYSLLRGKKLLNLDSEAEGIVTVGCAGGVRTDLSYRAETVPFSGKALCLSLKGLRGGHSGENINSGRANANKLLGRFLLALEAEAGARLVSLAGGTKENAIPREANAVIAVSDQQIAEKTVEKLYGEIYNELSEEDGKFSYTLTECSIPEEMFAEKDSKAIMSLLSIVPNGVLKMSYRVKGMVEWSRTLGIVKTEGKTVSFVFSSRSAVEGQLDASERELEAIAGVLGFTVRHFGRYPGWDYKVDSALREIYLALAKERFGDEARASIIHAGLECGIISSNIPGLDAISFGPNMKDIHSPDEALDLASTERFFEMIRAILEK